MKPSAIPPEMTLFASPSRLPENQIPQTLCRFIGRIAETKPLRKTVSPSDRSPVESPRNAPVSPRARQASDRVRRVPNRSASVPPARLLNRPASDTVPHIAPI